MNYTSAGPACSHAWKINDILHITLKISRNEAMVAKPYSLLQIDEVDLNESFLGDLWLLITTHQSLSIPHSYSIIASPQRMLAAIDSLSFLLCWPIACLI